METPLHRSASYEEIRLTVLISLLVESVDEVETVRLKTEFFNRLRSKFHDRCHKAAYKLYKGLSDWEAQKDDVFQDTFIIAFDSLKHFKINPTWDDEECQRVLLFWLSDIANKLFLKTAKREKRDKESNRKFLIDVSENAEGDILKRQTNELTYDKSKFKEFYDGLSPMSKEILFACLDYDTLNEPTSAHISGKEIEFLTEKNNIDSCAIPKAVQKGMSKLSKQDRNTDHLPDEVIKHLTSKYNVKPSAIRKSKQRALEGLRKCKI